VSMTRIRCDRCGYVQIHCICGAIIDRIRAMPYLSLPVVNAVARQIREGRWDAQIAKVSELGVDGVADLILLMAEQSYGWPQSD